MGPLSKRLSALDLSGAGGVGQTGLTDANRQKATRSLPLTQHTSLVQIVMLVESVQPLEKYATVESPRCEPPEPYHVLPEGACL